MKAKTIAVAILTITACVIGILAWNVPLRPSVAKWPLEPQWPRVELTPPQAEVFTDAIVSLTDALEGDLEQNNGRQATTILGEWRSQNPNPNLTPIHESVSVLVQQGPIGYEHLFGLLSFASEIDKVSERGDVIFQSRIEQGTFVVLVQNVTLEDVQRIRMYP